MFKVLFAFFLLPVMIGCGTPANKSAKEKVAEGEELFKLNVCTKCHSISGKEMYGPALNAILNANIVTIRGGKEVLVKIDREFIQRAIQNPNFEKDINFRGQKMPKPALSQEEIDRITDFLIFINTKEL